MLKNCPTAIKCENCPSVLKNQTCFQTHLKFKHLKREKPQCDICGSELAYKFLLKKHFATKHRNLSN
jgi:hypothetical protein